MPHLLIAIDGPAASGKTTLARNLSAHYAIPFIPSGNLYRAMTFLVCALGVNPSDEPAIASIVDSAPLHCSVIEGQFLVSLRDACPLSAKLGPVASDLSSQLRTPEVNSSVPAVSAHPVVRNYVTKLLRALGGTESCVVEGRDIGTVVFPNATFKIFLDAPVELRQARRHKDGENDCVVTRDRADSTRSTAPLQAAPDAIHLTCGLASSPEKLAKKAISALRVPGHT